jgi:hypothetical protein
MNHSEIVEEKNSCRAKTYLFIKYQKEILHSFVFLLKKCSHAYLLEFYTNKTFETNTFILDPFMPF